MSDSQIADAVLTVNNDVIGYVPNSLMFTEGLGEQKVLPVSEGDGRVSQTFANDLETAFGRVSFSIRTTVKNVERAREWKQNANRNVITVTGTDPNGGDFTRSFTQMAVTADYEVQIQAEGTIELEFMGNAPI